MESRIAQYYRIADMPTEERPRERLALNGASGLNNRELLAILLRTGTGGRSALDLAHELVSHFGGLRGLAQASLDQICQVKGVGTAKAAQVLAALELSKRLLVAAPDSRPQITSPADAANLLQLEMGLLEQEHLRVLLLDSKNCVQSVSEVYVGNVNTSVVRVAEVFRDAVRNNCPFIIVAHNHPSGDPTPSREDISTTQKIAKAGELLNIEMLDHIIIGLNRYVSLKERGISFR